MSIFTNYGQIIVNQKGIEHRLDTLIAVTERIAIALEQLAGLARQVQTKPHESADARARALDGQ